MSIDCGNKAMGNTEEDRISSLPDGILHHILSFLDMKSVVQTCVLSTRWRYLWTSLSVLNFDARMFPNPIEEFVDKVLALRENVGIQRFCLLCDVDSIGILPQSLYSWIVAAVERNVQELILDITIDDVEYEMPKLPHCLFTCKSLKIMKLCIADGGLYTYHIDLPDLISLPSLKTLRLGLICFRDAKLASKFFSSCPLLESLIIDGISFRSLDDFVIYAPKLKHFVSRIYVVIRSNDKILTNYKIKIYAPHLVSFECKDDMSTEYHLQSCSSLETADIDIEIFEYYNYDMKHGKIKDVYGQSIIRCLEGVSNVKALTLSSASMFEFLSESPTLLESLRMQFCNLRYLKLEMFLSKDCICAIIHLLKISPVLETLDLELAQYPSTKCYSRQLLKHPFYPYWDEKKFGSGNAVEYWEVGLSLPCILHYLQYLHHLKFVKLQNVLGCVNELKLLEILLEAAMVMEKLVVFTSKIQSADREGRLPKFREKLLTFPRLSSNVEISFY